MAAEPYTIGLSLTLPPDTGQPLSTRDYSFSGTFTHKVEHKLELSASGTHVVGMGTIPNTGAKAVLIEYENNASGLQAINIRINGGTDDAQVTPGGVYFLSNPSASDGITAISIVHTSVGTVRVTLLA